MRRMARRIEIGRRERAVARESSVGRSSVKGIAAIVTVGLGFSVPRTAMIQGVCIYVSVVCCSVSFCVLLSRDRSGGLGGKKV